MTATDTDQALQAVEAQVTAWRRHLHQHPELSFQEHQTAAYVEAELRKMPGLTVTRPSATSVLAVLKGGLPGKTVLLRADMDALPITEENDFEFVSTNPGVMHACGHDGHTAILLGVAQVLSARQGTVPGEIRMIFQHAEELFPGGAEELVEGGLMDGVDVATGLHLNSMIPAGVVAVKPGEFMASPDVFHITVKGRGAHAAHPEEGVDPIAVGAQVVANLQHIVSRGTSALDALVVSVTQFHAGTADNIIPDSATLTGTVRCFDTGIRERAPKMIERILKGVTEAHGAEYTLDYQFGYRPVINTDWVVDVLREVAREEVGAEWLAEARPSMGGEDFSAYLTRVPGAYFNVGAGNAEAGITAPHHHPRFTVDERSLITGVRMLAGAAVRLAQG